MSGLKVIRMDSKAYRRMISRIDEKDPLPLYYYQFIRLAYLGWFKWDEDVMFRVTHAMIVISAIMMVASVAGAFFASAEPAFTAVRAGAALSLALLIIAGLTPASYILFRSIPVGWLPRTLRRVVHYA